MVPYRFAAVDSLVNVVERYVDVVIDLLLPIIWTGFSCRAAISIGRGKDLFQLAKFVLLPVLFVWKRLPVSGGEQQANKQRGLKANSDTKSHNDSLAKQR